MKGVISRTVHSFPVGQGGIWRTAKNGGEQTITLLPYVSPPHYGLNISTALHPSTSNREDGAVSFCS